MAQPKAQPKAKPAAPTDLYAVLGVQRSAEPEVIDAAYRALARKYHPDVNRSTDADERTRALNDAYRTLHDPIARARYDAELSLRVRPRAPARESRPAEDRPIDLFSAALGDVWRRAQRNARSKPVAKEAASGGRVRRRWALPALTLGAGLAAGVALASGAAGLGGGAGRALRAYWSAASAGRAAVAEARQPHEAISAAGYGAAASNPTFGSVATQLIAALERATARLRAAGAIPPEVEAYHFLQLDDWREERDLRFVQREAIHNRSPEAWGAASERELAWRASVLHAKAEVAAAQVAALVARR